MTSYTLTYRDAVVVWYLHRAGWTQQRIAAAFSVNQGRINEVLKCQKFPDAWSDI